MVYEEILEDRNGFDRHDSFERDLNIIRRDLMTVKQDTASVRARMTEFSSLRPAVSKRFIVVAGMLCFIVVAGLVICQSQLQAWLQGTRLLEPLR